MSEENKDNETGGGTAGSGIGGFFDSLIADFPVGKDAGDHASPDNKAVEDEDADGYKKIYYGSGSSSEKEFSADEFAPDEIVPRDDAAAAPISDCSIYFNEAAAQGGGIGKKTGFNVDDIIVLYDAEKESADKKNAADESHADNDPTGQAYVRGPEENKSSGSTERQSGLKKFFDGIVPVKGDSIPEIIRKIVFISAVAVFIGAGVMLVSTLIQSEEAIEDERKIDEIVTTTAATTINEKGEIVTVTASREEEEEHNFSVMEYYKGINHDVVGFIEIDGCDIRQPVVQTTDNEYYLTHTYYNGVNKAGSIFMDYRCTVSEDRMSPNIVLYGHNQQDGTMFGDLRYYKYDVNFYAANPLVKFNTEYGVGYYVIFGYFITNTLESQSRNKEVFHYQDYIETLSDEYTFDWYMRQIERRNQIISPVDVVYGDELLVLSTCSNEFSDSRFVVFARRLRDDETIDSFDFSTAVINNAAEDFDWDAIMSLPTVVTVTTSDTLSETTEETTVPESETEESEPTETAAPETTSESVTETEPPTHTTAEESTSSVHTTTEPPETTTEAPGTTTEKTEKTTTAARTTAGATSAETVPETETTTTTVSETTANIYTIPRADTTSETTEEPAHGAFVHHMLTTTAASEETEGE
ncbi:MAG: class B sortase [Oscillospiraceae bacterium]|nr:class B sortase [Oscillospiraceae bacterium]